MRNLGFLATTFALVCTQSAAQSTQPAGRIRDWSYDEKSDLTEAFTANESGSLFGIICGKNCYFYFSSGTQCEKDVKYAAIINTPTSAYSVTMRCVPTSEKYIELIDGVDLVDSLKDGDQLGIAIPLKDGRFSVSRFSLTGSLAATRWAVDRAAELEKNSEKKLRDFTL